MLVFKFGGASVKDAERLRNVASILQRYKDQSILIVVSAMGKSTNELEAVLASHAQQDGQAHALYEEFKKRHWALAREIFDDQDDIFNALNDTFVEAEWVLDERPADNYDYMYDQLVSIGELVSTRIVAAFLNNFPAQWDPKLGIHVT